MAGERGLLLLVHLELQDKILFLESLLLLAAVVVAHLIALRQLETQVFLVVLAVVVHLVIQVLVLEDQDKVLQIKEMQEIFLQALLANLILVAVVEAQELLV